MKDKTLFGMLNDDYRELVLKENEMKKVKANIREKSRLRKLNESVNVNVTPDGNINVNVEENKEPVVPVEPVAEVAVEEPSEEIIEEGCSKEDDKKESCETDEACSKKEAEVISKNPEEGDIEFSGYNNVLKEVAKEIFGDSAELDYNSTEPGEAYVQYRVNHDVPGEGDIWFGLSVTDTPYGAPGDAAEKFSNSGKRMLQFYTSDKYEGTEPAFEKDFDGNTPISSLKQSFNDMLMTSEDVKNTIKKIADLKDMAQYRADNNITDSEKLKESETEEEIGEEVIDSVISRIAATDEELANKVRELLAKEPKEEVEEVIEEEPFEECEIASYKVTRIAPKANAYMLEAQTKDGLKYIIGKNFNETEKTLDEAEILDNKIDASNKFRSLLK